MDAHSINRLGRLQQTNNSDRGEGKNTNVLLPPGAFQAMLAEESTKTLSSAKGLSLSSVSANYQDHPMSPRIPESIPLQHFQSWYEQLKLYKQEQLLAHPGGDDAEVKGTIHPREQGSPGTFLGNLAKDVADGISNLENFMHDVFFGSQHQYVDTNGDIQSGQRKGLLGNVVSFFKNVASALSLGHYRSDQSPEPQGILERTAFGLKKLFNGAVMDDLVFGIPSSAINLLDDALLAGWNLTEVIPDATIGTIPEGQKLVTSIFDNGQVAIDYITDCLPTGEAWMRVHGYGVNEGTFSPPGLFNLTLPENYPQDSRWSTVRNTPLRKTIETIGSILADLGAAVPAYFTLHTSKGRD